MRGAVTRRARRRPRRSGLIAELYARHLHRTRQGGAAFTLSWTATHDPTAGYITQGQDVRLLRPLPWGTARLPRIEDHHRARSGHLHVHAYHRERLRAEHVLDDCPGQRYCHRPDVPTVLDRIGLAALAISGHDPNLRKYDVLWTVNTLTPTSPVMSGFYVPYNREPLGVPGEPARFGAEAHHPISWYRANHPDWLVYRSDRTTLALSFEYRTPAGVPYHLPPTGSSFESMAGWLI
jgi:hypothetical protein